MVGDSPSWARPSTSRADRRSTARPTPSPSFSLAIACRPSCRRSSAPSDTLGWGAGLATPVHGQLLRPGHHPDGRRHLRPVVDRRRLHTSQLSYSVENRPPSTAETVPTPTVVPLPTTAAGTGHHPARPAGGRHRPRALRGPGQPCWTPPPPRRPPSGTTCMPYTVGAPGDGLELRHPAVGHRAPAGRPTPGAWPSTPSSAWTGIRSLEPPSTGRRSFPSCNASAPTAATCGPSAMTLRIASAPPPTRPPTWPCRTTSTTGSRSAGATPCRWPW